MPRTARLLLASAGLLLLAPFLSAPSDAASGHDADATTRVVRKLVATGRTTHAQAVAHQRGIGGAEREPRNPAVPGGAAATGSRDVALQTSAPGSGAPVAATPATVPLNAKGLGVDDNLFSLHYAPPDTNGAVGDTYYVQAVNSQYAVYSKATGARITEPLDGSALFDDLVGTAGARCATRDDGDPIVQYDKVNRRWIFTQFVADASPYLECVAVSTTDDPRGTYRGFAFSYGSDFPDYPKVGVWPGSYLISYNLFRGNSFAGAEVCAMDRAAMVSAGDTPADQQCWRTSTAYGGLLPADVDGTTQPTGDAYVVSRSGAKLATWRVHVVWGGAGSTMTKVADATGVAAFVTPCTGACVPQKGVGQKLDTLGDRVMYRLAYRKLATREALVVTHAVQTASRKGTVAFRWYELQPSGTGLSVRQQGTYAPDATHRWMSTAAMAGNGAIVVGYSASSSSSYPSIRFAARGGSDALNTLQNEVLVQAGAGSQGPNLSRWGDYASMSVDPVDDCAMWLTTEYLTKNGSFNWSTRIVKIVPPGC